MIKISTPADKKFVQLLFLLHFEKSYENKINLSGHEKSKSQTSWVWHFDIESRLFHWADGKCERQQWPDCTLVLSLPLYSFYQESPENVYVAKNGGKEKKTSGTLAWEFITIYRLR